MREGGDVLANRRGEVLTFDKVHVLAAGISENVAYPSLILIAPNFGVVYP